MTESTSSQMSNGVLCCLQLGYWGASAKIDPKKLGEDVPKKIVRGMQDLLDDKLLIQDIYTVLRQAHSFVKNNSLPFPVDTITFVPKHKVPEINERLNELDEELQARVERLIDKYDALKKRFKKKYPKYFRPEKYPTKSALRRRYYMQWKFFNMVAPEITSTELDPKQYKREVDKFKDMVKEMEEMTITLIGNQVLERIDKLHKQCTTGEGLHGKTVNSINKLLAKWDDLWKGHVDDKQMKVIIARLRKEMNKVSIDRLKNNDDFRNKIGDKLGSMMKKLENIPDVGLKRKLAL